MSSNARSRMGAYGRSPKALLRDPALSARAKVIVAIVDEVAGHEEVTIARLATWLGCKDDTARAAVHEAAEAGWLEVTEQWDGGRRAANLYTANAEPFQEGHPETGGYALPQNGGAHSQETGVTVLPQNGGAIRNETNETLTTDAAKAAPTPKSGEPRAKRLPEDWEPSNDLAAWAQSKVPGVNVSLETEKFRNYWLAKAGRDATKVSWERTWKNWLLTAYERTPQARQQPSRGVVVGEALVSDATARQRAWLEARGSSLEEYEKRKTETGWLDSLKAMEVDDRG